MASTYVMDFAGATLDQYDAVIADMELGGQLPAGASFHAAGLLDGSLRVIDVWEDEAAFDEFAATKIGPLSAKHGVPEPRMQRLEVTSFQSGGAGQAASVQLVALPGIDAETFERLNAGVLGDAGIPPECIFHVNGPTADGWYVMDAWTSEDARQRFIDDQVGPAMQAAGAPTQPDFTVFAVHGTLPQRTSVAV